MLYAFLIYEAEDVSASYTTDDEARALQGHRRIQERWKAEGRFVEANQLLPGNVSTSVAMHSGKAVIRDGPFVETKELLLGYYILECANLDEAIQQAQLIPHVQTGGVEVRPIAYFERAETAAAVWTHSA